jgi:AraC family carnitine catabolism transcriptional activator
VLVPGGYGARVFSEKEALVLQLRRLCEHAELIAGIGSGLFPLARAGLLAGLRVAGERDSAAALQELEPTLAIDADASVVESERVLSAAGSGHALELSLAIVRRTLGSKLYTMVASELGLELPETTERLEIRY